MSKNTRFSSAILLLAFLVSTLVPADVSASSYDSLTGTAFDTVDDAGMGETSYAIRFGSTLQKELSYSTTLSRFIFGAGIKVQGSISGSSLTIDGQSNFSGALTARTTITANGTLSGNQLVVSGNATFSGITFFKNGITAKSVLSGSSLIVSNASSFSGTISALRNVTVKGIFSGASLVVSGASSFSGAALFRASLTVKGTLSGSSFFGAGLGDCNNPTTSKLIYNSTTGKFSCATDQTGGSTGGTGGGSNWSNTGSLQTAFDTRYVNTSGDTMTGGLVVDVTSQDTVKTTTGNTNATDFSVAGSTLTNVTDTNDLLAENPGTVPASGQGTMASSTIVTSATIRSGAMTILRDDGRYAIIHGYGLATASLWDGISETMTTYSQNPSSVVLGASGSLALKRPDGQYLVIAGGGSTTSSVFDPWGITATSAGPTLTSCTTGGGTSAFLVGSGSYVILCGGSGNWGVYNGTANAYTPGAALGSAFGPGAHAIQLNDGTFLVFAGHNSTAHWIYNSGMPMNASWSTINPIPTNAPTITNGAFSIRRTDGKFLVLGGAANASTIYDPTPSSTAPFGTFTAQSGAGYGPTTTLKDNAQSIWRQDGKFLLFVGSGSTATNIVDISREDGNQFVAGPSVTGGTPAAGFHVFMDARGLFRLILGGVTTTTATYNSGYIRGGPSTSTGAIYESECITASLHSGSYLTWKTNADDISMRFQVKTGKNACSGTYKYIGTKGDLIRPTSGDDRVQIKVTFERGTPTFAHQEWGLRRGISQTQYRRLINDPALYEIVIRNVAHLHRTQFDFGNSSDPSGPLAVNLVNDRNRNLSMQLANGVVYPTTVNTTNANFYNGAFVTHVQAARPNSNLTSGSFNIGTVVLRRPDGKYVLVAGSRSGAIATSYVYDPTKGTMLQQSAAPNVGLSSGALAFKRPDGQFFIVAGGNRTNTSIYDPVNNTFTQGPPMMGRVGEGAAAIPLPNGRVMILHGQFQRTTTLYDPRNNTTSSGAMSLLRIGRGSLVIPKPNGSYLVIPGTSSHLCALQTATMIFDPYANWFQPGTVSVTTGTGPGALTFERSDGQWIILKGGATLNSCVLGTAASNIYNPFTNRMLIGPVPGAAQRYGSSAMQRPDGSWFIVNGGGVATTQIYYEKSGAWTADGFPGPIGTFVASASAPSPLTIGSGSIAFQRDDGKYVVLIGGSYAGSQGSGTTLLYDAGWVSEGFYRSEAINIPDLSSTSTLSWSSPDYDGISAQVRTGTSAISLLKGGGTEKEIPGPGSRISPDTGDTYVQIQFSFRRTFPSMPGILEDVWYNGGSAPAQRWRNMKSPTITEFSIGKDTDLMNLRSDKVSLFRVNSNGDIYTGTKGALNSGGADLAERYTSADPLEAGDLVTFDYTDDHSVRRSTTPYQPELLGIVSSNPGFVAGAYTKNSFPIALVGRVPVNVTLENGPIVTGDRITSSGIPGIAMKATRAGRVVGVALESAKSETFKPCAADPEKLCGQIMVFVNLTDWYGPDPSSP